MIFRFFFHSQQILPLPRTLHKGSFVKRLSVLILLQQVNKCHTIFYFQFIFSCKICFYCRYCYAFAISSCGGARDEAWDVLLILFWYWFAFHRFFCSVFGPLLTWFWSVFRLTLFAICFGDLFKFIWPFLNYWWCFLILV